MTRRVGFVTAVLAVCAVLLPACGSGDQRDSDSPSSGWTRLPDPPLSPRTGGVAAWTGKEAVFLGGETKDLCPPNADCIRAATTARDGAAYDPSSRKWRSLPDAPTPISAGTLHTVVNGTLVVVGDGGSWHALDDRSWRSLPAPPSPPALAVRSLGGKIVTIGTNGRVEVLDLQQETWSLLPRSPHRPTLNAHHAIPTAAGVVVIGQDPTADDADPPYLLAEKYADGRWRRLERSDMIGGYGWHWTGDRLVSLDLQCADGGETNPFGRCIPEGGVLDPATGRWSELPDIPELGSGGWNVHAAQAARMLGWGYLYDDATRTWTPIPRPDGAPERQAAATWADDTIIAFGGLDWVKGRADLSARAWAWTP